MINAIRKDTHADRVFQAAMVGIDLEAYGENSVEEKRKEIERRAAERIHGYKAVQRSEFAEFGLTFEDNTDIE